MIDYRTIDKGELALASLKEAYKYLSSARTWGLIDIFGGGLISTVIKHSKVDSAKKAIREAERNLYYFSQSLSTLPNLDVDISDLLCIADIFFDGAISDLFVQSRIIEAQRKVEDAIDATESALIKLRLS